MQALYLYQFSNPFLGVEVAKGWMPIFAQLCADVDQILGEDKRCFCWSQIKEKFGSARFYYRFEGRQPGLRLDIMMPGGVLSQHLPVKRRIRSESDRTFHEIDTAVQKLAMQAEKAIQNVCLVCGRDGTPDRSGGYVLVLCPQHQAQRREPGGLPQGDWEHLGEEP